MARTKNNGVWGGATQAKKVPRADLCGKQSSSILSPVYARAYGNPHRAFSPSRKTTYTPPSFSHFVREIHFQSMFL